MILHADPAHHQLALLSIPRDLFIPNARSTGPNKIDAGLYQGLSQLVAAIEEDFGIPIQHAVSLNFDQFANIVDALGGINMSFPESVFDAESGLNVQAATCVHLDGTQALQVVRARHLQYDAPGTTTSDAEYWPQEGAERPGPHQPRSRVPPGLGDRRGEAGAGESDHRPGPHQLGEGRSHLRSVVVGERHGQPRGRLPLGQHRLGPPAHPPGCRGDRSGRAGGSLVYQGGSYGDVEFPSQAQDQSVIDQVLGIGATTDSMTGSPLAGAVVGDRFGDERDRRVQSGHRYVRRAGRARVSTWSAWVTPRRWAMSPRPSSTTARGAPPPRPRPSRWSVPSPVR